MLSLARKTFGESCGIFAVYGTPHAARLTHLGLFALQHRGQESAGIVASDRCRIRHIKGQGLLADAVRRGDLETLQGDLAIGHVRYSTTGASKPQNVQPLILEYAKGLLAVAHNGNLVNAKALRRQCEARGSIFQTSTDSEIVVHLLARPEHADLPRPLARCLAMLKGAYSFVFLTKKSIIAARDPHGFRPLAMGRLGDAVVFASETCAFDLIGAAYERDVAPGEVIEVSESGMTTYRIEKADEEAVSHCIFEHIYFARPDSLVFGESVHDVRVQFGRQLAREHPVEADAVVAVPDSGRSAALGYTRESGIPADRAFVRNHYVGRTFIMPVEQGRGNSVDIKLNAVRSVVAGKRLIVVDDSIIRGTTARRRVKLLRDAGAREIHLRIACPPCRCPCFYGIDFPSPGELLAANSTVEEIREFLGVESLGYLSVAGMLGCVQRSEQYCTACFTGRYPEEIKERVEKLALENASLR